MIKVSGPYPNEEGARFDMDYYVHQHIALGQRLVADASKNIAGRIGSRPGSDTVGVADFVTL